MSKKEKLAKAARNRQAVQRNRRKVAKKKADREANKPNSGWNKKGNIIRWRI